MALFACPHCGDLVEFLGDGPREPQCDCGAIMEPDPLQASADAPDEVLT